MYLNERFFKRYDDMYYVSASGDVYSKASKKILKHYIDHDGYHRVDIHGKHIKVHKLVYSVWRRKLNTGEQLNHRDDNKDHNNLLNLYIGTQKENIRDQFTNGSRLGHVIAVTLLDKELGKIITFPSVKIFLDEYSGHSATNGSLSKVKKCKWFKRRFKILDQKRVETIESYNSLLKKYREQVS